jgi:hypothetical protein
VDEYETDFSKIFYFVDHINHNGIEKAIRFFEGLNSKYRHVIGVNQPNDSMVEQDRGMELQIHLTEAEVSNTSGTGGMCSGIGGVMKTDLKLPCNLLLRSPSPIDNPNQHPNTCLSFLPSCVTQGANSCASFLGRA